MKSFSNFLKEGIPSNILSKLKDAEIKILNPIKSKEDRKLLNRLMSTGEFWYNHGKPFIVFNIKTSSGKPGFGSLYFSPEADTYGIDLKFDGNISWTGVKSFEDGKKLLKKELMLNV